MELLSLLPVGPVTVALVIGISALLIVKWKIMGCLIKSILILLLFWACLYLLRSIAFL